MELSSDYITELDVKYEQYHNFDLRTESSPSLLETDWHRATQYWFSSLSKLYKIYSGDSEIKYKNVNTVLDSNTVTLLNLTSKHWETCKKRNTYKVSFNIAELQKFKEIFLKEDIKENNNNFIYNYYDDLDFNKEITDLTFTFSINSIKIDEEDFIRYIFSKTKANDNIECSKTELSDAIEVRDAETVVDATYKNNDSTEGVETVGDTTYKNNDSTECPNDSEEILSDETLLLLIPETDKTVEKNNKMCFLNDKYTVQYALDVYKKLVESGKLKHNRDTLLTFLYRMTKDYVPKDFKPIPRILWNGTKNQLFAFINLKYIDCYSPYKNACQFYEGPNNEIFKPSTAKKYLSKTAMTQMKTVFGIVD